MCVCVFVCGNGTSDTLQLCTIRSLFLSIYRVYYPIQLTVSVQLLESYRIRNSKVPTRRRGGIFEVPQPLLPLPPLTVVSPAVGGATFPRRRWWWRVSDASFRCCQSVAWRTANGTWCGTVWTSGRRAQSPQRHWSVPANPSVPRTEDNSGQRSTSPARPTTVPAVPAGTPWPGKAPARRQVAAWCDRCDGHSEGAWRERKKERIVENSIKLICY